MGPPCTPNARPVGYGACVGSHPASAGSVSAIRLRPIGVGRKCCTRMKPRPSGRGGSFALLARSLGRSCPGGDGSPSYTGRLDCVKGGLKATARLANEAPRPEGQGFKIVHHLPTLMGCGRRPMSTYLPLKGMRGVARTGFEPVVFALKGRHPRPLDDRARWRSARSQGTGSQSPCQPTVSLVDRL